MCRTVVSLIWRHWYPFNIAPFLRYNEEIIVFGCPLSCVSSTAIFCFKFFTDCHKHMLYIGIKANLWKRRSDFTRLCPDPKCPSDISVFHYFWFFFLAYYHSVTVTELWMHGVYSLIVMKHWKTIHAVECMEFCKTRKIVKQVQENMHC